MTSDLGVLIGRRADITPPWAFPSVKIEPGESPEDAAVREVLEETGLVVQATRVLGHRVHPQTRRPLVYVGAEPVHTAGIHITAPAELTEVRWVGLSEAGDLMPGMFGPVRAYLVQMIG